MFLGFLWFLGWSFTVGGQAQVAAAELYRSVLAGKGRLPGERLDQGPVRQVQGRPGRLFVSYADGQRVAAGVCGDLPRLAACAQLAPSDWGRRAMRRLRGAQGVWGAGQALHDRRGPGGSSPRG